MESTTTTNMVPNNNGISTGAETTPVTPAQNDMITITSSTVIWIAICVGVVIALIAFGIAIAACVTADNDCDGNNNAYSTHMGSTMPLASLDGSPQLNCVEISPPMGSEAKIVSLEVSGGNGTYSQNTTIISSTAEKVVFETFLRSPHSDPINPIDLTSIPPTTDTTVSGIWAPSEANLLQMNNTSTIALIAFDTFQSSVVADMSLLRNLCVFTPDAYEVGQKWSCRRTPIIFPKPLELDLSLATQTINVHDPKTIVDDSVVAAWVSDGGTSSVYCMSSIGKYFMVNLPPTNLPHCSVDIEAVNIGQYELCVFSGKQDVYSTLNYVVCDTTQPSGDINAVGAGTLYMEIEADKSGFVGGKQCSAMASIGKVNNNTIHESLANVATTTPPTITVESSVEVQMPVSDSDPEKGAFSLLVQYVGEKKQPGTSNNLLVYYLKNYMKTKEQVLVAVRYTRSDMQQNWQRAWARKFRLDSISPSAYPGTLSSTSIWYNDKPAIQLFRSWNNVAMVFQDSVPATAETDINNPSDLLATSLPLVTQHNLDTTPTGCALIQPNLQLISLDNRFSTIERHTIEWSIIASNE